MLGGSMDFYGQMPSAYDWASFEFLAHENYSSWKIFMHKLLYFYGQEHLDIVLGKHTRLDAEDKDKFDAVDEIALSTIRLAIDKEIHPWVLDVFSSSKELWNSLQFKFEIDAVMADMRDDTEIVQEEVLGTLCHGDYKTEEEHAAWIKREQSDRVFIVKDNMNLLKSYDVSHFPQEFQLCEGKYDEFDACHIVDNASQDIIQQLEVPFIDNYLEVSDLSSLVQSFMSISEYAAKVRLENKPWKLAASDALTSLCLLEDHVQQGQNNSYMETVAPTDDLHVVCLHEHRDEIFEHQVYTADFQDELVLQLPWMDIYEQNAGFSSIITKVSKHEVDFPLYIHLHIPLACTHDEIAKDHTSLVDCLGYVACTDIQGISQILKVSFECLHLRNQVLLIIDMAEDQNMFDYDVKSGTWSQVLAVL